MFKNAFIAVIDVRPTHISMDACVGRDLDVYFHSLDVFFAPNQTTKGKDELTKPCLPNAYKLLYAHYL